MSLKFQNFFYGVGLVPNASDVNTQKGQLNVVTGDGKLYYHNGTSSSPVVTESHQATLSNKTLTAPVINNATADTITGIAGGNLALNSDLLDNRKVTINGLEFTDTSIFGPTTLTISSGSLSLESQGNVTVKPFTSLPPGTAMEVEFGSNAAVIKRGDLQFGEGTSVLTLGKNPSLTSSYSLYFPATAPTANTALVYDGTDFIWGTTGGGAADGGLGDDLITTTYLASITDDFTDATYLTTNTFKTNAIFNGDDDLYTILFDKVTGSSSGTTVTLTSAPSYIAAINDVIVYQNQVRTITGVTSQTSFTVDSAFSSNIPAASDLVVSRAFYSKDIYNETFGGNALSDAFTSSFSEVLVDYEDADEGSTIFNLSNAPLIGYSISQDNTTWSDVYARPTSSLTELDSVNFSTAGNNLYVRFFAIDGTGASVNLLKYKAYMQKIATESNGGILNFAYANTNGAGTEVNCTVDLIGGKTAVTLDWQYVVGVESLNNSPYGSVDVYLDGKLVPRYIDGTTTPGPYYSELSPYIIQFDADYSGSSLRIEILRRVAVIYNENAANTANLEAVTFDGIAGEVLAPGEIVYISKGTGGDSGRTAGRVYKAEAANDDRINFVGVVTTVAGIGDTVTVQVSGEVAGLTGLSLGEQLFLSTTTPGGVVNVAPSAANQWVVQVGIAKSAFSLILNGAGSATAVKITSEVTENLYADVQTYSVNTTLTNANSVVLVNASGGSRTMTLPTPTTNRGKIFNIKKIDSSLNTVILAAPMGVTIDGSATRTLSNQYDSIMAVSNGTNYFLI
jgi:hypothetical protein